MTTKSKNRQPHLHTRYVVRVSSAKMPSKCWGKYVHVGVIAVHGKYTAQLRDTASQSVVWYRSCQFSGLTDRCASARAIRDAERAVRRHEAAYYEELAAGYLESLTTRSTADEL